MHKIKNQKSKNLRSGYVTNEKSRHLQISEKYLNQKLNSIFKPIKVHTIFK